MHTITEAVDKLFLDLKKMVCDDVFDKLPEVQAPSLERIHRVGRPEDNKARPVIARFID